MAKSKSRQTKLNEKQEKTTEMVENNKDKETSSRSIDVAEEASVSVRELNNLILKLKPLVKQAKARTIQKVVRKIQSLKKTKGSEENVEKARLKAEKLLDEIFTIKSLELDQLAQYALGNTSSFFHISAQQDVPIEIKAMTRVSDNPVVQKYVKSFREQHKDWEKLGDFMLFKQSGRRYKHAPKENRTERIKTSEALVKTYINKKFSGDLDKIKKVENISNNVLSRKYPAKDDAPNGAKTEKRKLFKSIATVNDSNDDSDQDVKNDLETKSEAISKSKSSRQADESDNSDASESESKDRADVSDSSDSDNDSDIADSSDDNVINNNQHNDTNNKSNDIEISTIKNNKQSIKNLKQNTIIKEKKNSISSSDQSDNSESNFDSDNELTVSKLKVARSKKLVDVVTNPKKNSQKELQITKATELTIVKKMKKTKAKKNVANIVQPKPTEDTNKISDTEFIVKKTKEMVVKKIDWDNFGSFMDVRPLRFGSQPEIKKTKRKSDFFESTGDVDSSDDDDVINKTGETTEDTVPATEIKGYGRNLMETTFVKSLGGPPKPKNPQSSNNKQKTKLEIQVKRQINSQLKNKDKHNKTSKKVFKGPNTDKQPASNVHPSWAASMKRKQEQGMISAFQGKKIKFDD